MNIPYCESPFIKIQNGKIKNDLHKSIRLCLLFYNGRVHVVGLRTLWSRNRQQPLCIIHFLISLFEQLIHLLLPP